MCKGLALLSRQGNWALVVVCARSMLLDFHGRIFGAVDRHVDHENLQSGVTGVRTGDEGVFDL